jgi:hypothetical protein
MKRVLLKKYKSIFFVGCIYILVSGSIYAFSTGVTSRTMKGSSPGCSCYGSKPTVSVYVRIQDPDSVEINQTAIFTLSISIGPLVRRGQI